MHRIAHYDSSVIAYLHAAHLRENGVMAGVIDGSISVISPIYNAAMMKGEFELVIASKKATDRARDLLEELELDPPHIEDGWEDDIRPDLNLLKKEHIPECPTCDTTLCVSRPFGPCIRCRTNYDLMQLVFDRFGPDALASCYEQTEPLANHTDAEVCSIDLDCPSCSYPLDGLPIEAHCPECGSWFNRRELFGNILKPL